MDFLSNFLVFITVINVQLTNKGNFYINRTIIPLKVKFYVLKIQLRAKASHKMANKSYILFGACCLQASLVFFCS